MMFRGYVEERVHIWARHLENGMAFPKEKEFLWTPIEFELDEEGSEICSNSKLDEILEDARTNNHTAKIMESWEYITAQLIPFLQENGSKFKAHKYPEYDFVFLPRFIKGTYILPRLD